MELVFDISQDELPIFMAETDDHLQALDEILVRLEQENNDPELIQTVFRSAHTLKGMAGMIGHKRMVALTHALETALDGVRKDKIEVSTPLIDLCLDAVDGLRQLREDVVTNQMSQVDVESLTENFSTFLQTTQADNLSYHLAAKTVQPASEALAQAPLNANGNKRINISAVVDDHSVASAARAFQILLVLQAAGQIERMHPTQEDIENAAPVKQFEAQIISSMPLEKIQAELEMISEISQIVLTEESEKKAEQPAPEVTAAYQEPTQLGEYLVAEKIVSAAQIEAALRQQKSSPGKELLLGQLLVQMGAVTQQKLDAAVVSLIKKQREAAALSSQKNRLEQRGDMMVRTSVERLDSLMNLVGELITDRNHLFQVRNKLDNGAHGNESINQLSETVGHIGRITDQLQEEVMRIRMLPIGNVFHKFPRLVRDLAQNLGKQVDLVIEGEDTELDRSVIEEINDPLIHLIRNALDHGIETPQERQTHGKSPRGTLRLTARHEQGRIIITVEDDGAGINAAKIRESAVSKGLISEVEAATLSDEKAIDMIFLSGLSTSKKATDISGRGVGMDIVRANIQRINGTILVETKPGQGTHFQVVLPLTLAIVPTLLVKVSETPFAIPLVMVAETLRLEGKDIQTIRGEPVTRLRNQVLPLVYMKDVFGIAKNTAREKFFYVVVVHSGKQRIGLVVDELLGEEEVVVKSFGSLINEVPGISSAAILGDGHVALIVDVVGLYKLSGIR